MASPVALPSVCIPGTTFRARCWPARAAPRTPSVAARVGYRSLQTRSALLLTRGFDPADVGLLFWLCGCAGLRGGWVVLLAYDRFPCSPMSISNAYACCGNGD